MGNHYVTYIVFYTLMVKAFEDDSTRGAAVPTHFPAQTGVHMPTTQISTILEGVETERTRQELPEAYQPMVPFDAEAQVEVMVMEDDPSFLVSFDHKALAQVIVINRLLVR